MITAANLRTQTVKDLSQLARKLGVSGWHEMRKDQLIRVLVRAAKAKDSKPVRAVRPAKSRPPVKSERRATAKVVAPPTKPETARHAGPPPTKAAKSKSPQVLKRIHEVQRKREELKDLSRPGPSLPSNTAKMNGKKPKVVLSPKSVGKDRVVLLVRDPFWLHVIWDVSAAAVQRARAAMAEFWHTARPILRLLEVEAGNTTSSAERIARDIDIHGGVKNWYIPVDEPPQSFRVDMGYVAANGRFHTIARSNVVTTPEPGSADAIDQNWVDVAANYEKIFALSGGYAEENQSSELQELFEERLRRPMGPPASTRYGAGAEQIIPRHREFVFELDAEMIVFGRASSDAHVSLGGEPVKLRPDGSFTVRIGLPDRRQVLPVVASSSDGAEQRTIVLAVERNTKVMEPMVRESSD